jgi:alkanesulfonate monooxygenase SsuD/methylene tetrahydromethanopterin reductase-like flavin-dependent oxidoreductase (luciferase family)
MEFGIFNGLFLPHQLVDRDPRGAEHRRLMENVDYTVAADRAGIKYVWVTEHHFLTEYSHMSANESFLPYLAARTDRIHIGSGIFNITPPVNHPARIAERAAMLDHLSEGRFELGVGRGSSTTEMGGFGITDAELTRDMIDEVLPELLAMWGDEEYPGHEGRFFSMPPRNVIPKPFTKPGPPIWMAAGNPSTFEKAARLGVGVLCFTVGDGGFDRLARSIESYKKAIAHADPVGGYVNDNIMVSTSLLCFEDAGKARRIATDCATRYHSSLVFRYLDTFPRPDGIPQWPDVIPEPTLESIEASIAAREAPIGSPDEIERVMQRYVDIGVDQVTFGSLSTTISIEDAVESISTFGRHVLPRFDRDPIHSTKRQREAQLGPDAVTSSTQDGSR